MDKYICRKRKVIPKEQCEYIIWHFNNSWKNKKDLIYGIEERGYQGVFGTVEEYPFFSTILKHHLTEYIKKHNFLEDVLHNNLSLPNSRFHIQKYFPGNSYSIEHMEHGPFKNMLVRVLAWMVYLNDIKKDGGTRWPQQNFTSKPRSGDLYIWPAGWTHSHYGIPAPNEEKYIVTGWCSMNEM